MNNPKASTYAVIVGAEDYTLYDPSGQNDLAGARNDARAWWRLFVDKLQLPPEQITVLTSPPLSPAELAGDHEALEDAAEKTTLGRANAQEIFTAYRQMIQRVQETSAGGEDPNALSNGIFTWSGHGAGSASQFRGDPEQGAGLGLCPSDISLTPDGELQHALEYTDLLDEAPRAVIDRITFVIDACYTPDTQAPSSGRRGLRARTLSAPSGRPARAPTPPATERSDGEPFVAGRGRLMLASQYSGLAYEIQIGSEARGAFSWSLASMMEQWRTAPAREDDPDGPRRLRATYNDLSFRTRAMLSVLNVAQIPRLSGMDRLYDLAVFQPGQALLPMGSTSPEPDAEARGSQLTSEVSGFIAYGLIIDPANQPDAPMVVAFSGNRAAADPPLTVQQTTALTPGPHEVWCLAGSQIPQLTSAGQSLRIQAYAACKLGEVQDSGVAESELEQGLGLLRFAGDQSAGFGVSLTSPASPGYWDRVSDSDSIPGTLSGQGGDAPSWSPPPPQLPNVDMSWYRYPATGAATLWLGFRIPPSGDRIDELHWYALDTRLPGLPQTDQMTGPPGSPGVVQWSARVPPYEIDMQRAAAPPAVNPQWNYKKITPQWISI